MKKLTKKQMRSEIVRIMVEDGIDTLALPAKVALRLGIEYITLRSIKNIQGINFDEAYVRIDDKDIPELYHVVRKELNRISIFELNEDEAAKLENEVVKGSVYIADYENSFGVPAEEVAAYMDGYLETKDNPEEYGEYETFYDYLQSIDY